MENLKYTYIVCEVQPEKLQEELCSLGAEGWLLCNIIPLQRITPGSLMINGQPKAELIYQLVFKTDMF